MPHGGRKKVAADFRMPTRLFGTNVYSGSPSRARTYDLRINSPCSDSDSHKYTSRHADERRHECAIDASLTEQIGKAKKTGLWHEPNRDRRGAGERPLSVQERLYGPHAENGDSMALSTR
jgi:hypothetical protein